MCHLFRIQSVWAIFNRPQKSCPFFVIPLRQLKLINISLTKGRIDVNFRTVKEVNSYCDNIILVCWKVNQLSSYTLDPKFKMLFDCHSVTRGTALLLPIHMFRLNYFPVPSYGSSRRSRLTMTNYHMNTTRANYLGHHLSIRLCNSDKGPRFSSFMLPRFIWFSYVSLVQGHTWCDYITSIGLMVVLPGSLTCDLECSQRMKSSCVKHDELGCHSVA